MTRKWGGRKSTGEAFVLLLRLRCLLLCFWEIIPPAQRPCSPTSSVPPRATCSPFGFSGSKTHTKHLWCKLCVKFTYWIVIYYWIFYMHILFTYWILFSIISCGENWMNFLADPIHELHLSITRNWNIIILKQTWNNNHK